MGYKGVHDCAIVFGFHDRDMVEEAEKAVAAHVEEGLKSMCIQVWLKGTLFEADTKERL